MRKMTTVYLFDITNLTLKEDELKKFIPLNLHKRIDEYKLESDRILSCVSYFLLNKYLKDDYDIDISNFELLVNEYGKPFIEKNINFSISHSFNYVALIISSNPCGIDIELVEKEKDYSKLKLKLGLKENALNDEIISSWVKMEAYYKYLGIGIKYNSLNVDLNNVDVNLMEVYDKLNNKYKLAYIGKDAEIKIIKGI